MDLMVVPKPVFKASKEVEGYYLSFQIGNALLSEGKAYALEARVTSPFMEFINDIGLEVLTNNKPVFMPVTNIVLAGSLENDCGVDPALVVLLLDRGITLDENAQCRLVRLKEAGFKIAFYNMPDFHAIEEFLPLADYIFAPYETSEIMPITRAVRMGRHAARVIASGVNTDAVFERTAGIGIQYFEGAFYKMLSGKHDNRVSPLQVNYLQLLNQVAQEDFDFGKFSGVVQRDPALVIQFLKMVKSGDSGREITSLRHAAAMVGQKEIKRWVTTAVASSLNQGKPSEITRISLLRAKFCENLAGLFEMGVHMENLFLMGLFSSLDVILEMPIEKALGMIVVPEKVKIALTTGENDFGEIYRFIMLYEQGDWQEVSRFALIHNLAVNDIFKAYYESLTWYGRLINTQVDSDVN